MAVETINWSRVSPWSRPISENSAAVYVTLPRGCAGASSVGAPRRRRRRGRPGSRPTSSPVGADHPFAGGISPGGSGPLLLSSCHVAEQRATWRCSFMARFLSGAGDAPGAAGCRQGRPPRLAFDLRWGVAQCMDRPRLRGCPPRPDLDVGPPLRYGSLTNPDSAGCAPGRPWWIDVTNAPEVGRRWPNTPPGTMPGLRSLRLLDAFLEFCGSGTRPRVAHWPHRVPLRMSRRSQQAEGPELRRGAEERHRRPAMDKSCSAASAPKSVAIGPGAHPPRRPAGFVHHARSSAASLSSKVFRPGG